MEFTGRLWLVRDASGKLIDDIDTDMIFHNAHLAITELDQMGQHAFGNLEGYKDFPDKVQKGDIVVVGENFGSGSSRAQAVDCFVALGVSCIIAGSYGAIYKRNGINSAFPIFQIKSFNLDGIEDKSTATVLPMEGKIVVDGKTVIELDTPPQVQLDILKAGGLFEYAKTV